MTGRSAAAVAVAIALAAGSAACSGSSSAAGSSSVALRSTTAICVKLEADSKPLETQTASPSSAQVASELNTASQRFAADVADASDPAVKAGVDKVATTLRTTAAALTSSQSPNVQKLTADLQSAETYLNRICPAAK
jgi:hypothetical protein